MKKGGCWIFLSHSSRDIEKVRFIRNEFEKHGQNPLAFHLRCLNTYTPEGRKELDSLIKREIDCREWFVFCESPAAAKSEYVCMEKSYIIDTGKKKIWSVDMELDYEALKNKVEEICTQIKVFISYARTDGSMLANMLCDELEKKDFDVWDSKDFVQDEKPGISKIESDIDYAAKYGFVIILYTEDYIHSAWCKTEMEYTIGSGANALVIGLGDVKIPDELRKKYHCYQIPAIPEEQHAYLLRELVEAELRRKIEGPVLLQAEVLNKISEINEKLNYENRYHPEEAVRIFAGGATNDYIEVYKFPCCGKEVVVGDGPVSPIRADGCCFKVKNK